MVGLWVSGLVVGFVDGLVGKWVGWLVGWLVCWMIAGLVDGLVGWCRFSKTHGMEDGWQQRTDPINFCFRSR